MSSKIKKVVKGPPSAIAKKGKAEKGPAFGKKGRQFEGKRKRKAFVRFVETKFDQEDEDDLKLTDILSDVDDDDLDDDIKHSKLLSKISELNANKRRKVETRLEASGIVSDLHLTSSKEKVNLADLLDSVNDPSGELKKLIKSRERKKILETPLNKPEQDYVQRQAFYADVSKDITKWDSVVEANRNADQLSFPLNDGHVRLESSHDVITRYQSKNEFELEVEKLLKSSKNNLKDDKPLTEAEEKFLKTVNFEEAKARHRELQRMRMLLSYQETKLKRQKKIKSKKYHRILKKERLKKQVKEFEQLKEDNPEAALEKLAELDKIRALERASLRHKNTGKWAKHHQLRSKYDDTARDALSEQVDLANQLLKKNTILSDSEDEKWPENDQEKEKDEGADEDDDEVPNFPADFNPWMKTQKELLEKIIEEQKVQDEPEVDEESSSAANNEKSSAVVAAKPQVVKDLKLSYFNVKDTVQNIDTDDDGDEDEDVDEKAEERRQLVAEAFADDDVVNEFVEEKEEVAERERPKDQSLFLPGWGAWGGPSIKEDKSKKEAFTIKAKVTKRKDFALGNVIISEKKSESVSKFMVSELPFPYKNVVQFENSVRHPVGSTWNPEAAFRNMTEPAVITKMGKIIEPMDQESLPKKTPRKKIFKAKKKVESNKV